MRVMHWLRMQCQKKKNQNQTSTHTWFCYSYCSCTLQINGKDTVFITSLTFLAISYTYNYNKQPYAQDPYYSIKVDIPSLNDQSYGYLAGAAFTVPISIVGIFMVSVYFFTILGVCLRQSES